MSSTDSNTTSGIWTSPDPSDRTGAGTSIRPTGAILALLAGIAIGIQRNLNGRVHGDLSHTSIVNEYNERTAQLAALYAELLRKVGSLGRAELKPGVRWEELSFLRELSSQEESIFFEAFERLLKTRSRKLSDRALSSMLRVTPDLASPSTRSKYVALLLGQLRSDSPSQASAAAVSLGELGDDFVIPALKQAVQEIRWPSVRADVSESIDEISSQ